MKRLNTRGIVHYAAPLAVAMLVAVGGVAALVASHADSITTSKKARCPAYQINGGVGTKDSDVAHSNTGVCGTVALSCSIDGLTASVASRNSGKNTVTTDAPTLTIRNTGTRAAQFNMYVTTGFDIREGGGPAKSPAPHLARHFSQGLGAGSTSQHKLPSAGLRINRQLSPYVVATYQAGFGQNDIALCGNSEIVFAYQ